jgi:hypothetical protein
VKESEARIKTEGGGNTTDKIASFPSSLIILLM